jgi:hypothetical protein
MKSLFALLALGSIIACSPKGSGSSQDPNQNQLPRITVKLPPSPSFKKEHAPEIYADASYSVYGLRKNMKTLLNKEIRVRGFLTEVYECPPCPRGAKCKKCRKPHFYIADRANWPKEKALLITNYPQMDRRRRRKKKYKIGALYHISGTFARSSGTGFSASDGLVVSKEATKISTAPSL